MNIYVAQDDELITELKKWIKNNPFDPKEFNITPVPKECHFWYGLTHTEETKIKMSESAKGKIRSQEHSNNISKAKRGKKIGSFSEEHKTKISKALKGISKPPMSKETKDKISKSCGKGNHYSAMPVIINGISYSCKKEAIEKLNMSKHHLNKLLASHLT